MSGAWDVRAVCVPPGDPAGSGMTSAFTSSTDTAMAAPLS